MIKKYKCRGLASLGALVPSSDRPLIFECCVLCEIKIQRNTFVSKWAALSKHDTTLATRPCVCCKTSVATLCTCVWVPSSAWLLVGCLAGCEAELNWTELNVYWHTCSKNSWIAEYKIIKTVWSKAIQSTDTIEANDFEVIQAQLYSNSSAWMLVETTLVTEFQ